MPLGNWLGQVGPTNIQWYTVLSATLLSHRPWYGVVWPGTVWYGVANIQATFRHCQVSAANSINHHTAMLIITKPQSQVSDIWVG